MARLLPGRRWPRFAALEPTTTPSYIATGTFDGISPFLGTNIAGDRFLLHAVVRNETVPLGAIAGWTLKDGPDTVGPIGQYYLSRDAPSTGSESGSVTLTDLAGNSIIAAIHTFRDWSGVIEAMTSGGESASPDRQTVEALSVAAGGNHRLACTLVGVSNNDNTIAAFTGESGGDWAENFYAGTAAGSDCEQQLQTAALDAGGTISGGSCSNSDDEYVIHAFALVGT